MKRMSILLAGTAIPLALLLSAEVEAREAPDRPAPIVATATQDVMILAQREGRPGGERGERRRGRDAPADAAAEAAAEEAEEAAAAAAEAEARAEALAAEAAAAQAAAAAADAEADAEAEAAALAEEAEAAARAAAQARAQAEAAEREAVELRDRAEAEAAAEAEGEAASEREAEAERRRAAEREDEAAAEAAAAGPAPEASRELVEEAPRETLQETPPAVAAQPAPERERRRDRQPIAEPALTATEAPPADIRAEEEPQRFEEVREGRRARVEEGVTIIEEPGARTILQEGDQLIILQDEEERARRAFRDVRRERRDDRDVLVAPRDGGVEIITVLDTQGNLLRRIRREADGSEVVLIDNTPDIRAERRWDGRDDRRRDERRTDRRDRRDGDRLIGPVGSVFEFRIDVPPPVVRVPRDRYIVDYGDIYGEDYLEEIFLAPPVSEIRSRFTLDEVRFNPNLRDYMPRVDLDTVTFDTGSWRLTRAQIDRLERVADAMNRVIDRNPNEIFLIEGHTDAVGRAIDNLSLSDRRAESVAFILSEYYDVPPENLVTQGYGEEFLKIDTQAAERRNRRVTIRRITPLMAQAPRG